MIVGVAHPFRRCIVVQQRARHALRPDVALFERAAAAEGSSSRSVVDGLRLPQPQIGALPAELGLAQAHARLEVGVETLCVRPAAGDVGRSAD
tara:strand:+ start:327 stop:605 length:279 start_codon:yes stop_codon:yes gene_type:complete